MNESILVNLCETLNRIYRASRDDITNGCIEDDPLPVTEDGVPIRKLFISNLADRTTYKDLAALFSKYGKVESCFLRRNEGRQSYAFVTFSNVLDATKARRDGGRREITLHKRDLRVMAADSWHQPDSIENQYYHIHAKDKSDKKISTEQCDQEYAQNEDPSTCIHTLNDDCLMHIFLYLPIVDRVRVERVCKRWRAISQESWCTVKKLDLSQSTWGFPQTSPRSAIDTVTLRKVLLRCGRFLNHMNFAQISHRLSQSTLTIVAKLCPNLQTINITALTVSASGITSLAHNCEDITRFSLGPSTYTCDNDLISLFRLNKKLEYLKVTTNNISGKCLLHLPSESVEEIVLERCNYIQGLRLSEALPKLKKLKSLSINHCIGLISSVVVAISIHSKTLKMLELSGSFPMIHSKDMLYITELTNLEVLNVGGNTAVKDEFLEKLASNCLHLTYIDIQGCVSITDSGIAAIATLPKLEKLIISYLHVSAHGLHDMYNLRQLECRGCEFLDDGVATVIAQSSNLELFDLSGCSCITNNTLHSAVVSTNRRINNIMLKIYVGGTAVTFYELFGVSPFLQIINVDLSLSDTCKYSVTENIDFDIEENDGNFISVESSDDDGNDNKS